MPTNPISCYTLTLTSANTNYNLRTLVLAINSAERGSFAEISLVSVDGIDGVGGNSNDILIGDANLATTRYFVSLGSGGTYTMNSGDEANRIPLGALFARSAGAGQKLNVLLRSS